MRITIRHRGNGPPSTSRHSELSCNSFRHSEIAHASVRGTAVNTFNNFLTGGILLVIVAGAASDSWRAAVVAMAVPNLVTLLAMVMFGLETPYFLVSINK